jgi:uncharacterized OB-fold protein
MKNSAWNDEEDDEDEVFDDELNGDDTTQPCPNCGRQVYDDAEQCPHCGHYITEEEASHTNKPWWIIAGFILCFAIVLYWLFA